MTKDWLVYQIDNWSIKTWHIQLNTYNENWQIANTYPITYSTEKKIDEIIEKEIEKKVVEDFADVDEEWNDFVNKRVVKKTEIETTNTGQKISNPNYRDPQSISDLEEICIERWFEK